MTTALNAGSATTNVGGKVIFSMEFRLASPVLASQRPLSAGEPAQSLDYVPGLMLRGALAYRMLGGRQLDEIGDAATQAKFRRLFLEGKVRYGPLLPTHSGAAHLPVPTSLWTCKDAPWSGKKDPGHGLTDLLAYLLGDNPSLDVRCEVPECCSSLDRVNKQFASYKNEGETIDKIDPPHRLIQRTAIDPVRGTARAGLLYSLMPMGTGAKLAGCLVAEPDVAADVEEMCQSMLNGEGVGEKELVVAAKRSSGLGRLYLDHSEGMLSPWPKLDSIKARIRRFNDHVRTVGHNPQAGIDFTYIPITLATDTILLDDYLAPATKPSPHLLERYSKLLRLEGAMPEMKLVYWMQSMRDTGGWNMLEGLPRLKHKAISPGSVWVYQTEGSPDKLGPEEWRWLASLERDGIGELTQVGYGTLVIANPLHLQGGDSDE